MIEVESRSALGLYNREQRIGRSNMALPHSKSESFQLFNAIAKRYDFVNSVLSLGLHHSWRRSLCEKVPAGGKLRALDLATGTGDVAISLVKNTAVRDVQGIDMSEGMINEGRIKLKSLHLSDNIELSLGDAQAIPYDDASFDVATISFGIRNVANVPQCLSETLRVLKPGGRMLVLEFALPQNGAFRSLHLWYLRNVLPKLGKVLTGHDVAYKYLNETIEEFPYGENFSQLMTDAGFVNTGFQSLSAGIVNLYWGDKA